MFSRTLLRSGIVVLTLACVVSPSAQAQKADPYLQKRLKMVKECIEREGITNPRVIDAMRQVPRHEFVDPNMKKDAYVDAALPIGHKQTISPPFVVAYMTQTIDPQPDDRILEIGTGSGFQAAVLSNLCKEVYSIEIVEPLGKQAAERLKRLGYANVTPRIGDGYQGWPEHAPFDKIIVTCSPESVPQPLVDQLKEGGKLLVPLGERYQQVFHMFEKKDGKLINTKLIPTLFVPMTGKSEDLRQVKPDPLNPKLLNGSFEDDEDDNGPDHWHYQRLMTVDLKEPQDGKKCALFENATPGRVSQALQAMGVDGTKIGSLHFELDYKVELAQAGTHDYEMPALVVLFYDENRRNLEPGSIGPWLGTREWRTTSATIAVPPKAREMIIRIGLNGATGKLWVDNVRMTYKRR